MADQPTWAGCFEKMENYSSRNFNFFTAPKGCKWKIFALRLPSSVQSVAMQWWLSLHMHNERNSNIQLCMHDFNDNSRNFNGSFKMSKKLWLGKLQQTMGITRVQFWKLIIFIFPPLIRWGAVAVAVAVVLFVKRSHNSLHILRFSFVLSFNERVLLQHKPRL